MGTMTMTRNVLLLSSLLMVSSGTVGCAPDETEVDDTNVNEALSTGACESYRHHLNDGGANQTFVEVYYTSCGDNWRIDTISVSPYVASRGGYYAPVIRRYSGPNYKAPLVITWQAPAQWVGENETYEWYPNWIVPKSLNPYVYDWEPSTGYTSNVLRLR